MKSLKILLACSLLILGSCDDDEDNDSTGPSAGQWTSSRPSIAGVNPSTGEITPVSRGTAQICRSPAQGSFPCFLVTIQ